MIYIGIVVQYWLWDIWTIVYLVLAKTCTWSTHISTYNISIIITNTINTINNNNRILDRERVWIYRYLIRWCINSIPHHHNSHMLTNKLSGSDALTICIYSTFRIINPSLPSIHTTTTITIIHITHIIDIIDIRYYKIKTIYT